MFGLSDASTQMTWIVAAVFAVFAIHHGLGRHMYYLSLTPEYLIDYGQIAKWQFLSEISTAISLFFTRISISLFLLRIFGAIRYWRLILYYTMAFIALMNISSITVILIQCRPLKKNWEPLVQGNCVGPTVMTFAIYYNGGKLFHRTFHSKLNVL